MKRVWPIPLLQRLSLRQKLLLTAVLCLVVPTVLTLWGTSYFAKNVLREQAAKNAADSLEVVSRYIVNLVNRMIYVTNYIQFDPDISAIVRENWNAYRTGQTVAVADQVAYAKKASQKLEAITMPNEKMTISILLPNDTYFTNYSFTEYHPRSFTGEAWFGQLKRMESYDAYWLGIHANYLESAKTESPYVITVARTIRQSSEPIAVIVVSIAEQQLRQILQADVSNQEIALVDSRGTVLSHRDERYIGNTLPFWAKLPSDGKPTIEAFNGEPHVLVRRQLPFADWELVSAVPYKDAAGKINKIQQTNFMIQLGFFSVFLLILIYLIREFTKPIVRLGRIAAKVEAGQMHVRSGIRGSDEIGRLGTSFDQMLDRIQEMIGQIRAEQVMKRKAELEMLQAQINPHFLFNVLNSIRMRIMLNGDEENAALISSLSNLLRMTINRNNEWITLQEEANTVAHYVKLMNFRHNEQIRLETVLSPETLTVEVPRFFLQPLIENAFIHGLNQSKGTIRLSAWKAGPNMIVRIADDGKGMDGEQLKKLRMKLGEPDAGRAGALGNEADAGRAEKGGTRHKREMTGIGVKNVYERLKLLYGAGFRAEIESEPGRGTVITLVLPLKANEREGEFRVSGDAG